MTHSHTISDKKPASSSRWNAENTFIVEIQIQYFHAGIKKQFPLIKSTFKDISFLGVLVLKTTEKERIFKVYTDDEILAK